MVSCEFCDDFKGTFYTEPSHDYFCSIYINVSFLKICVFVFKWEVCVCVQVGEVFFCSSWRFVIVFKFEVEKEGKYCAQMIKKYL